VGRFAPKIELNIDSARALPSRIFPFCGRTAGVTPRIVVLRVGPGLDVGGVHDECAFGGHAAVTDRPHRPRDPGRGSERERPGRPFPADFVLSPHTVPSRDLADARIIQSLSPLAKFFLLISAKRREKQELKTES
jgi:hypothetical protein